MASHVSTLDSRKRVRRTFGHLEEITPMPNLIDVQRSSYDTFLQMDVAAHQRDVHGLEETFKSVFPIEDFAGRAKLEFVSYSLETPKYDVEECQQRGLTYASPLKVTLRLEVWEEDEDTGARSIRDIKEQDVLNFTGQHTTLNGGSDGHHLIRVHGLIGILTGGALHKLQHSRNPGGTTHHHNLVKLT